LNFPEINATACGSLFRNCHSKCISFLSKTKKSSTRE